MNITLSAEKELIMKSREYAKMHHTTLNHLVRGFLDRLSGGDDVEKVVEEFKQLAESMPGKSDEGYTFSRDAIYDRN